MPQHYCRGITFKKKSSLVKGNLIVCEDKANHVLYVENWFELLKNEF